MSTLRMVRWFSKSLLKTAIQTKIETIDAQILKMNITGPIMIPLFDTQFMKVFNIAWVVIKPPITETILV